MSENNSQKRTLSERIADLSQESDREDARTIGEKVVRMSISEYVNRENAISELTSTYGFKSWLKRLLRGDEVTIHRHFYNRLCLALEERNHRMLMEIEQNKFLLEKTRKADAAIQRTAADGGECYHCCPHEDLNLA